MDLLLTDGDLDLTNGDVTFVTGKQAIAQDVTMALRTWMGETPYDRTAGVPYLQIIFAPGTTPQSVRFIVEQIIRSRVGVLDVLDLDVQVDGDEATITGRIRASDGEEVSFAAVTG